MSREAQIQTVAGAAALMGLSLCVTAALLHKRISDIAYKAMVYAGAGTGIIGSATAIVPLFTNCKRAPATPDNTPPATPPESSEPVTKPPIRYSRIYFENGSVSPGNETWNVFFDGAPHPGFISISREAYAQGRVPSTNQIMRDALKVLLQYLEKYEPDEIKQSNHES